MSNEQRKITARWLTTAGWLKGSFNLPPSTLFMEHLNHVKDVYRLTDVELLRTHEKFPYTALHRDSVTFILPPDDEEQLRRLPSESTLAVHRIKCFLSIGELEGDIRMPEKFRPTDFFQANQGFLLFENVHAELHGVKNPLEVPRLIVNGYQVLVAAGS